MGTEINFRKLIDLAIGTPEPGHVNFYALHFLLFSFAEKLNIIDDPVDNTKYENFSRVLSSGKFGSDSNEQYQGTIFTRTNKYPKGANNFVKYHNSREVGGADPEEPAEGEEEFEMDNVTEPQSNKDEVPPEIEEEVVLETATPATAVHIEEQPIRQMSSERQQSQRQTPLEIVPAIESLTHEVSPAQAVEVKTSAEKLDLNAQQTQQPRATYELYRGVSIMKDQLELTMEIVRNLAMIALDKKAMPAELHKIRSAWEKMTAIQRDNIYIENAYGFRFTAEPEKGYIEEEVEEESDDLSEPSYKSPLSSHIMEKEKTKEKQQQQQEDYDLDAHLCYSPDKLLDQLLDLKSEFCLLTNKVNEITATILEQDCQRTTMHIADLQEQMKDLKFYVSKVKETADRMESKNNSNSEMLAEFNRAIEELMNEKIDKSEIEILLADKVDYSQLQRKVSQEQVQELQCRLEKQFCEVQKQIKTNEKNMYQIVDNMRTSLGLASVDDILNRFKDKIDTEIRGLHETLRKYMDATNDECAAAGARIKVLQDLACISCDTTCVMRTMEKAKVPKFPNAHATNLLSPLITYEISSIRKSGIMGYYRKDEYPHAPNAWLNQQRVAMKMCVPRHAGGSHTTHTAKEHFEKVTASKK
ncbi:myosin heavy chain, clone 203 [Eurosta solidaginis]|uniref:myosin heavy chain, clone 203 n=1 Tax=Eurosta solidaginis TaxID=178769 RepID=UPI0035308E4D